MASTARINGKMTEKGSHKFDFVSPDLAILEIQNSSITQQNSSTNTTSAYSKTFNCSILTNTSNHASSIIQVDVGHANYSGTFPTCLRHYGEYITSLNLGNNQFTGRIPEWVTWMTKLSALRLFDNSFSGTFPSGIMNLSSLTELDVSNNRLTGRLEDLLGCSGLNITNKASVASLKYLDISGNNFNGSIPSSLCPFRELVSLDLSDNCLSNTIPSAISGLASLMSLDIRNNELSGTISTSLCSIDTLGEVFASGNSFSCVPACLTAVGDDILDSTPHCYDSLQDDAICELANATSTATSVGGDVVSYSLNIWESDHPYSYNTLYSQTSGSYGDIFEVSVADAQQYTIVFDSTTTLGSVEVDGSIYYDSITFCETASCDSVFSPCPSTGYTSSTGYPGVRTNTSSTYLSVLDITATKFYVRFIAYTDDENWGYRFTGVARLSSGSGWSCNATVISNYTASYDYATGLCDTKSWAGVSCDGPRVVAVTLRSLGVSGKLPNSIGNLTTLSQLDLRYNDVHGTLPASLSRLSNMQLLDLSHNDFSGKLSSDLCPIASISAELSSNYFSCYESTCWSNDTSVSSTYQYCSPSSMPTSMPTQPTSSPTPAPVPKLKYVNQSSVNMILTVSSSVGGVVFIIAALYLFWQRRHAIQLKKIKEQRLQSLEKLPIHRALYNYQPEAAVAVVDAIQESPDTASLRDYDDNSAFDILLEKEGIAPEVVEAMLKSCMPTEDCVQSTSSKEKGGKIRDRDDDSDKVSDVRDDDSFHGIMKISPSGDHNDSFREHDRTRPLRRDLSANLGFFHSKAKTQRNFVQSSMSLTSAAAAAAAAAATDEKTLTSQYEDVFTFWTKIVQQDVFEGVVRNFLSDRTNEVLWLCDIKDTCKRRVLDIASPKCRAALLQFIYFMKRYEITTLAQPHHQSATCTVHLAVDHEDNQRSVALKFMKKRENFDRELQVRQKGSFDNAFIVNILRYYDGDVDEHFVDELQKRGFSVGSYCIVMEAADRNLNEIIEKERFAGLDWEKVRFISESISKAIGHMHAHGFMHGDLKPLNIVRAGRTVKLIDLDASANLNNLEDYSGIKFSSGYIPPELVYCASSVVCVRSPLHFGRMLGLGDEHEVTAEEVNTLWPNLVLASVAHDMWSLGVVVYNLCVNATLFLCDGDGNIKDEDDLRSLAAWTDELKHSKLKKIGNIFARNLVSQLLVKDPGRRLSVDRVLLHPFITGKKPARMDYDPVEYDVYVSYRMGSDSDLEFVRNLCAVLRQAGVRVWSAATHLRNDTNWSRQYCHALCKSRIFVPVLSRSALRNPSKPEFNFELLSAYSNCDDLLLEFRTAIETKERGLLEKIYPVFLGEYDTDTSTYTAYSWSGASSCHPTCPKIAVLNVEQRLREQLEHEGLGSPYRDYMTVLDVLGDLTRYQGGFVTGDLTSALQSLLESMTSMNVTGGPSNSNNASEANSLKVDDDANVVSSSTLDASS